MGECQDFPSKISCLTVPKNLVGQPSRVSLISGTEKMYASEGYVTISVEIFCFTVSKNFVGEPFCAVFQKISGRQKVYGLETLFDRNSGFFKSGKMANLR